MFKFKLRSQKCAKKMLKLSYIFIFIITVAIFSITFSINFKSIHLFKVLIIFIFILALIFTNLCSIKYQMYCGYLDKLTGLSNRCKLQIDLKKCTEKLTCFAVVFVDFNDFKLINDTKGHSAGDNILRRFGKEALKLNEDINTYRFGGDEFVFLIDSNIDQNILEVFSLNQKFRDLDFACGVVKFPEDFINIDLNNNLVEEILKLADKKMYEEKKNIKG